MDICEDLRDNQPELVIGDISCWILDMDNFVQQQTNGEKSLPLKDPLEFDT